VGSTARARLPGTAEGRLFVGLEVAGRRTFASALDWPGWSRSGRDEAAALEALLAARQRYASVAATVGLVVPALEADVVERLPGTATTAFGAPAVVFAADRRPVDAATASRHVALLVAGWAALDAIAATAPAALRRGPRGGGRDLVAIVAHVVAADAAYARQVGIRVREPDPDDQDEVQALREAILDVLRSPSDGSPLAGRRWPARFAARRIAWHAIDHAWEIEDRSGPG
jgi:hypothetical protein